MSDLDVADKVVPGVVLHVDDLVLGVDSVTHAVEGHSASEAIGENLTSETGKKTSGHFLSFYLLVFSPDVLKELLPGLPEIARLVAVVGGLGHVLGLVQLQQSLGYDVSGIMMCRVRDSRIWLTGWTCLN